MGFDISWSVSLLLFSYFFFNLNTGFFVHHHLQIHSFNFPLNYFQNYFQSELSLKSVSSINHLTSYLSFIFFNTLISIFCSLIIFLMKFTFMYVSLSLCILDQHFLCFLPFLWIFGNLSTICFLSGRLKALYVLYFYLFIFCFFRLLLIKPFHGFRVSNILIVETMSGRTNKQLLILWLGGRTQWVPFTDERNMQARSCLLHHGLSSLLGLQTHVSGVGNKASNTVSHNQLKYQGWLMRGHHSEHCLLTWPTWFTQVFLHLLPHK